MPGAINVGLGWCVLVDIFLLNLRRTGLGRGPGRVREKDYAAAILGVTAFYVQDYALRLGLYRRCQRRGSWW